MGQVCGCGRVEPEGDAARPRDPFPISGASAFGAVVDGPADPMTTPVTPGLAPPQKQLSGTSQVLSVGSSDGLGGTFAGKLPRQDTHRSNATADVPAVFQYQIPRRSIKCARMGKVGGAGSPRDRAVVLMERDDTQQVTVQWRVERVLGSGGFARVYEVAHSDTGEALACKLVDRRALEEPRKSSRGRTAVDMRVKLEWELKIHANIKHSNIACFHRCWEDDEHVFILLELIRGPDLLQLSRARGRFAEPEVSHLLSQLISAVRYLHYRCHVVHRDLKLGNVMLTERAQVKVLDFGFAAQLASPLERKSTMCGSPNYIAPEILDPDQAYGFEVDLWSIGVIAFTLFAGRAPFASGDVGTTYQRITEVSYRWPADMSPEPESVEMVASLLQAKPDKRASISQLGQCSFFRRFPTPAEPPPALLAATRPPPAARASDASPVPPARLASASPVPRPRGSSAVRTSPSPVSSARYGSPQAPRIGSRGSRGVSLSPARAAALQEASPRASGVRASQVSVSPARATAGSPMSRRGSQARSQSPQSPPASQKQLWKEGLF